MRYLFIDGNNLYATVFSIWNKNPGPDRSPLEIEFLNAITRHMGKVDPDRLVVAWDDPPSFRQQMYPSYKATSPEKPPGYEAGLWTCQKFLRHINLGQASSPGFEGDDIIATLCDQLQPEDRAVIVSSDKDFTQLVSHNVHLHLRTWSRANGGGLKILSSDNDVLEMMGVTPYWVPTLKAIISDSSDNLPGADGIGKYRALPLVDDYGSLEEIYAWLEADPGRFKPYLVQKMSACREMVFLQRHLVTMRRDVPFIELPDKGIPPAGQIALAIKAWRRKEATYD